MNQSQRPEEEIRDLMQDDGPKGSHRVIEFLVQILSIRIERSGQWQGQGRVYVCSVGLLACKRCRMQSICRGIVGFGLQSLRWGERQTSQRLEDDVAGVEE